MTEKDPFKATDQTIKHCITPSCFPAMPDASARLRLHPSEIPGSKHTDEIAVRIRIAHRLVTAEERR
ncbi:hypothetical protein, partial [Burkholderia cepacia]|uniref:hypothetical protein n=1 Tax=Burkholderia cepacia TaxID=292 RepID=UPI001E2EFAA0